MGKDTLSIKQKEILKFIQNELISKGYPPSVREICEAVGLRSTSTVHAHLVRLEKLGYIKRDPTKPRAIELINHNAFISNKELVNVPIVGKVTAGQPILAIENIEGTFPISVQFLGNQEVFLLSVKGDSMIEAGILDNDYVIVNQQPYAEDGDIVVALIGDEATVKTFFKKKDHIVLRPQNPYMDDIIVKDVSILGKVIGVIRLY